MKVAAFIIVGFILCIALPNEIKAKSKKPKRPLRLFCTGEDGNKYAKGKGYDDKESCKRYTCVKQGKKLKMKETKVPCGGSVDGAWSEWSSFGTCSTTCGTGAKTRTRTCTNPVPSNGGKACPGLKEQSVDCNSSPCGEPTPGGDLTATIQFLNASMESMETKLQDLQTSLESLMEKMIIMQSTSDNHESCLADVCSAMQGPKPEYDLVVTGGLNSDDERLDSSEIISPEGVCSTGIPPLPMALENHETVYFNDSLLVCGGVSEYGVQNKCYQLYKSSSQWSEGPSMNKERLAFSMTKAGKDVYIFGLPAIGYNRGTMEKLTVSSGKWTVMDQNLTNQYENNHCTLFMEKTNSLVLIGKYEKASFVEEFSLDTLVWKQLPPLPVYIFGYGCTVFNDTIVVSGGRFLDGSGKWQKNVYQFIGGNWTVLGEMVFDRLHPTMATLDNKLMIIGGAKHSNVRNTIEVMQQDGTFRVDQWLNEPRHSHSTTQIPRDAFNC